MRSTFAQRSSVHDEIHHPPRAVRRDKVHRVLEYSLVEDCDPQPSGVTPWRREPGSTGRDAMLSLDINRDDGTHDLRSKRILPTEERPSQYYVAAPSAISPPRAQGHMPEPLDTQGQGRHDRALRLDDLTNAAPDGVKRPHKRFSKESPLTQGTAPARKGPSLWRQGAMSPATRANAPSGLAEAGDVPSNEDSKVRKANMTGAWRLDNVAASSPPPPLPQQCVPSVERNVMQAGYNEHRAGVGRGPPEPASEYYAEHRSECAIPEYDADCSFSGDAFMMTEGEDPLPCHASDDKASACEAATSDDHAGHYGGGDSDVHARRGSSVSAASVSSGVKKKRFSDFLQPEVTDRLSLPQPYTAATTTTAPRVAEPWSSPAPAPEEFAPRRIAVVPAADSSPSPGAAGEAGPALGAEGSYAAGDRYHPSASPEELPSREAAAPGSAASKLEAALVKSDALEDENQRLLEWNQELQDELVALSEALQQKCAQEGDVARLEQKLRDKAELADNLRRKVRQLSERFAANPALAAGVGALDAASDAQPHGAGYGDDDVVAEMSAHIATVERERAEMELLYDEREDQLQSLQAELRSALRGKEQGDGRIAALEEHVKQLAGDVEALVAEAGEVEHLRSALRDKELQLTDAAQRRSSSEESLRREIHAAERTRDEVASECADWERRYKELRANYNDLAGRDGPGEPSAGDGHAAHDDAAHTVSDLIYLQQVVQSYVFSPAGIDCSLRVGNMEALSDRRKRLFNKSIGESCALSSEHTRTLITMVLNAVAQHEDRLGGDPREHGQHGADGGCDVQ